MGPGRGLISGGIAGAVLALALSAALPPAARAERIQSGDLVMSLRGGLAPPRLPRRGAAPAAARLASAISTVGHGPVPRVRRVEVALGGGAVLSADGLPVCPRARLRNATRTQARRRCGGALVGSGRLPLEVRLPGQLPLRRDPRALVFNGRGPRGGAALWVHAFVERPPASVVVAFRVHRRAGHWATVLVGHVPRAFAWFRLRGFELTLRRTYRRDGLVRGYLSASCPIPRPFTAGFFTFARTTYDLADGRRLSNTIVRGCRVAG